MPSNKGPAPKLIRVESMVETCAQCGMWLLRSPEYSNGLGGDKGHQCERCGCTSVQIRRGRPYGPKSALWARITEDFNEIWPYMHIFEFVGITSDPPLPNPNNSEEYEAWSNTWFDDELEDVQITE